MRRRAAYSRYSIAASSSSVPASTNPPWHYEDADGQLVGFDIEMAKLLARGLFDLTD